LKRSPIKDLKGIGVRDQKVKADTNSSSSMIESVPTIVTKLISNVVMVLGSCQFLLKPTLKMLQKWNSVFASEQTHLVSNSIHCARNCLFSKQLNLQTYCFKKTCYTYVKHCFSTQVTLSPEALSILSQVQLDTTIWTFRFHLYDH